MEDLNKNIYNELASRYENSGFDLDYECVLLFTTNIHIFGHSNKNKQGLIQTANSILILIYIIQSYLFENDS